ncbi:hypothetical protein Q8A67_001360 [Cirrhinus molitorella]|uniref:AIG1-type G domain-containing protein n=1 Tax=Cirrhinus molitorella TaxID=172907 RepID=A0AA88QBC8_9TELE|nr:hypothetical protein Q8A67_001360 [Cirrhinus molitorella]
MANRKGRLQTLHRSNSMERPPVMGGLRIVLLGKSLSENCEVGNIMLGEAMFDSEAPPDQVQRRRRMHKTVINVPHLLQRHLSDHQITQTVRECVNLSYPGPHVVVLLLKHDQCSREDQQHVEKVLHSFSERVYKHTMVLTTQEPDSIVSDVLKEIIKKCFNNHYNLKQSSSSAGLREKLENFAQNNSKHYLACDEFEGSEISRTKQVTEEGES